MFSLVRADGFTVFIDVFYGRRKCGWIKSFFFVGERDSVRRVFRVFEYLGVDGVFFSNVFGLEFRFSF